MTSPTGLPTLLRAEEVAELLRTSRGAIYTMAERGKLPGMYKLGRRLLFRRADIERWLEGQRVPAHPEAEVLVLPSATDKRAPHQEGVRR